MLRTRLDKVEIIVDLVHYGSRIRVERQQDNWLINSDHSVVSSGRLEHEWTVKTRNSKGPKLAEAVAQAGINNENQPLVVFFYFEFRVVFPIFVSTVPVDGSVY